MVFSSLTFVCVFLPLLILIYYLVKGRNNKNIILLTFSLFFYAWGEPVYVLLMIISIIANYYFALIINKHNEGGNLKKARMYLIISIVFSLSLLIYFKYAVFFIQSITALLNIEYEAGNLPLPIGISFYTFQILSYVIDVYRKKVAVNKNIILLATYLSMFAQLIAGPIVRYISISDELALREETLAGFYEGLKRFISGFAKKIIIANNMAIFADAVFNNDPSKSGTLIVWTGAIAYSFQIYYDFSGYSDMAIGLGKMFGFNFPENFNYPYIAKSITDFWRRWHISLSTWFRDYLYIPLGGNRVKVKKLARNLLIVWVITGLWHGASWNYVLWGLYYALLLIFEKFLLLKLFDKIPALLRHIYTISIFVIGWVIFRVESLNNMFVFLRQMFIYNKSNINEFLFVNDNVMPVMPYFVLAVIFAAPLINKVTYKAAEKSSIAAYASDFSLIIIFLVSIIFLVGSTFNPFIYFRF